MSNEAGPSRAGCPPGLVGAWALADIPSQRSPRPVLRLDPADLEETVSVADSEAVAEGLVDLEVRYYLTLPPDVFFSPFLSLLMILTTGPPPDGAPSGPRGGGRGGFDRDRRDRGSFRGGGEFGSGSNREPIRPRERGPPAFGREDRDGGPPGSVRDDRDRGDRDRYRDLDRDGGRERGDRDRYRDLDRDGGRDRDRYNDRTRDRDHVDRERGDRDRDHRDRGDRDRDRSRRDDDFRKRRHDEDDPYNRSLRRRF